MTMGRWLNGASLVERSRRVRAGWITFVATNVGALTHELVVPPLATGGAGRRTVGVTGTVEESSSLGGGSRSCHTGAEAGLAPGQAGLGKPPELGPGRYELACEVPWYYASGTSTTLTVAPRGIEYPHGV